MSYTEYDAFFKALGVPEENKLHYAQLLRHLHTPKNLRRLKQVLERFIETYSGAWLEDISIDGMIVDYTHSALNIARSLLAAGQNLPLSHQFHSSIIKRNSKKGPRTQHTKQNKDTSKVKLYKILRGTFKSNPYYPLHFLLNKENAYFFKWLRQILFVIPMIVKDKVEDEERLKSYEPVFLGLFFREMTEREEALAWLSEKDCSQCNSLRAFIGWLYEYRYYFRRKHHLSFTDLKAKGLKSSEDVKEQAIALYHEISKCIQILEIPLGYRKKRRTTITRGPTERPPSTLVPLYGVTALEGDVIVQLETLPDETDNNNALY